MRNLKKILAAITVIAILASMMAVPALSQASSMRQKQRF